MYLILCAPAAWLVSSSTLGLRRSVLLSVWLGVIATFLRACPSWLYTEEERQSNPSLGWYIHAGQIVNAGMAPLTQVAPSLLAQVWFPVRERGSATGIARISNAMGRGVAYFLGPWVVQTSGKKSSGVSNLFIFDPFCTFDRTSEPLTRFLSSVFSLSSIRFSVLSFFSSVFLFCFVFVHSV